MRGLDPLVLRLEVIEVLERHRLLRVEVLLLHILLIIISHMI